MHQSEPAITQMIKLKKILITKLPHQIVLDASQDLKTLWSLSESLPVLDNILYYKCNVIRKRGFLLEASKEIRALIFHQLHENRIAGHLGREPTLRSTNG